MSASARPGLCAPSTLGVAAFWAGLLMAYQRYPSEYDWRYMSISNLVYTDRNPAGYRWAWGGLMLCALGGLWWTTVLARNRRRAGARRQPPGIWALGLGYAFMVCALLPQRILGVPKGHEILALSAFFGICIGIVQLTLMAADRGFRLRSGTLPGRPRVYAALLAGFAVLPILLAGIAPAYVSYAHPDWPWVGLAWRARGVPVFLSFAFWEWITCAVFSAYTVGLCLATNLLAGGA